MSSSRNGVGLLGVFGLLGFVIVTVIIVYPMFRSMETGVEAKESADHTLQEVRETIRQQRNTSLDTHDFLNEALGR